MLGEVTEFGPDGWGVVRSGDETYPFHATAIGDGSRSVSVGTRVAFEVIPGGLGRWEAGNVEEV